MQDFAISSISLLTAGGACRVQGGAEPRPRDRRCRGPCVPEPQRALAGGWSSGVEVEGFFCWSHLRQLGGAGAILGFSSSRLDNDRLSHVAPAMRPASQTRPREAPENPS